MNEFYLSCKECILEGPRDFYGCFYLGPFNNSQSLTIANALRRTLLSEISGLGITSVQIEGIDHEYSSFLGIRESVLDFLLNLKQIVLTIDSNFELSNCVSPPSPPRRGEGMKHYPIESLFSNQKSVFGYLQIQGPGILRASDLKLPSFLKCVDPDQYIATLSENGKLNLKFEISKNQNSIQKNIFKEIYKIENNSKIFQLDPNFSPIKKVFYNIEPYNTFHSNNQVIYLELWTNGSIHPRSALYKALNLLNSTFSKLEKMKVLNDIYIRSILKSNQNYSKTIKKTSYHFYSSLPPHGGVGGGQNQKKIDKLEKSKFQNLNNKQNNFILDNSIKIMNLPFRIENCLIQANIFTLKDLYNCDFQSIPGLGNQSRNMLQKKLSLFISFLLPNSTIR